MRWPKSEDILLALGGGLATSLLGGYLLMIWLPPQPPGTVSTTEVEDDSKFVDTLPPEYNFYFDSAEKRRLALMSDLPNPRREPLAITTTETLVVLSTAAATPEVGDAVSQSIAKITTPISPAHQRYEQQRARRSSAAEKTADILNKAEYARHAEVEKPLPNGFRPSGLQQLSTEPQTNQQNTGSVRVAPRMVIAYQNNTIRPSGLQQLSMEPQTNQQNTGSVRVAPRNSRFIDITSDRTNNLHLLGQ